MSGISFGDHSPGYIKFYRAFQLSACVLCIAVLIVCAVRQDVRYLPILFITAGLSNVMEAVDRLRVKRGTKKKTGAAIVFIISATVLLALAAVSGYMLWR